MGLMWVVSLNGAFGFENLHVEERAEPKCGPRQVLVRLRAASLNARDVMMVTGAYNPRQKLPLVPCSDGAGEIAELGSEVSEWSLGERVCPTFAPLWLDGPLTRAGQRSALGGPNDGTLAEYFVADADALVRSPRHLSALEAACLPCAGVTAFRALVELGAMQPGQWLVCLGTGGVSLAGLSLAKALGVRVIITSRSAQKLALAAQLGAEHGIDAAQESELGNRVRALTDGEGAHHVLEVGGARTIEQSIRALRLGGTLSVIGVLSGSRPEVDLRPVLMQDLRMQGVFVGSRATFRRLVEVYEQHSLRPTIDRVFPVQEVRAAFEHTASGRQFGKVVLEFP